MMKVCQLIRECIRPQSDNDIEEIKENSEEKVENALVNEERPEIEDSTFISDKNNENKKVEKTKKQKNKVKREKKRKSKQNDLVKSAPLEVKPPVVPVTVPVKPVEKKPLKSILKKPRKFF
jgi:hypothetical protein